MHPALPVKSVRELIVLAKTRAGQLNYSSAGSGTSPHLSMELFRLMAGITLTHIPYKGSGPATVDLLAGQVQLSMPNVPDGVAAYQGRQAARPRRDQRQARDRLAGYSRHRGNVARLRSDSVVRILAPAGTSRDIVGKLQAEIARILVLPEVKDRLAADGADAVGSRPDEFAAYIRAELAKWGKVVKTGGIKLE